MFFSHLRDIWTLALCFAESCWLFLAQGHGGKSHKKRNYIIAYLEATRFHGSHPSNVWGVFGAHKEVILQTLHSIRLGFRWANQVRSANAHLTMHGHGQQVRVKDQTGNLCPVIATAALGYIKPLFDAYSWFRWPRPSKCFAYFLTCYDLWMTSNIGPPLLSKRTLKWHSPADPIQCTLIWLYCFCWVELQISTNEHFF